MPFIMTFSTRRKVTFWTLVLFWTLLYFFCFILFSFWCFINVWKLLHLWTCTEFVPIYTCINRFLFVFSPFWSVPLLNLFCQTCWKFPDNETFAFDFNVEAPPPPPPKCSCQLFTFLLHSPFYLMLIDTLFLISAILTGMQK